MTDRDVTVHDLTHRVEPGMTVYPGDPPVTVEARATHAADGYRVSAVSLGTHAGTHVDAPSHTEPDGRDLDAFGPGRFRWRALRVDCRHRGARTAITREDLPADPSPEADLLALWTGWDDHWGTDRYRDHPHLAPGAAEWCARHGLDVGIDAFGPDPTPPAPAESSDPDGDRARENGAGDEAGDGVGNGDGSGDRAWDTTEDGDEEWGVPAHHALLGSGRVIVENLRNLGAPPLRFELVAHPLRIDADAAPVRAVAVVE